MIAALFRFLRRFAAVFIFAESVLRTSDIGCALRRWFCCRFRPLSKHSVEPLRCRLLNLGSDMRRREFITLIGGAGAWPLAARAQSVLPVIGFMHSGNPHDQAPLAAAFRQGLHETGYIEDHNVKIEYRWAMGQYDRLPAMATDLAKRHVSVIAAMSTPAALAAKAATTVIPIVFETAADPVRIGLVLSLSQPGGNMTGVTQLNSEIMPKRLQLLHEFLPAATDFALLVNPTSSALAASAARNLQAAAQALGLRLHVVQARSDADFDAAFAQLSKLHVAGLVIAPDAFFFSRRVQLAKQSIRYALPAAFETREFVVSGGLVSYGGSFTESYRLAGVYVARILKGKRPNDLPVQQVTKVELSLNVKTAKALGISIPISILGRADEVVE
jgi:putative ABC transport system substrate-binding protein